MKDPAVTGTTDSNVPVLDLDDPMAEYYRTFDVAQREISRAHGTGRERPRTRAGATQEPTVQPTAARAE